MNHEHARAFVDEFFDGWYPHLLRYACGLVRQRSSAEEVVQDAFLELYRALCSGADVAHPKAWTMCVVRRKALARLREPFGIDRSHDSLSEDSAVSFDWMDGVETDIDSARVRGRMHLLSLREEEVLLLRLQSMKYREIASSLGITSNSVNTLLSRALDKLRGALEKPSDSRRRTSA